MDSFLDTLKTNFKENTPILHEEILSLFLNFDRLRINNLIESEIKKGTLIRYIKGVYYLPKKDPLTFNSPRPTVEEVMSKKYIYSNGHYYGFYSGLTLLNNFGLSKDIPTSYKIISNFESSSKRDVVIEGKRFTLSRSKVEITNDNVYTYILVELLYLNKDKKIEKDALDYIDSYIREHKITKEEVKKIMEFYPTRIYYDMIHCGVYQLL